MERTLSIIKPDAVKKNVIGKILARFEAAGLRIVAARMLHLSRAEAEGFYAVHRGRPFFNPLVEFMISGPVLVTVLEGENAISRNRELMGATDMDTWTRRWADYHMDWKPSHDERSYIGAYVVGLGSPRAVFERLFVR